MASERGTMSEASPRVFPRVQGRVVSRLERGDWVAGWRARAGSSASCFTIGSTPIGRRGPRGSTASGAEGRVATAAAARPAASAPASADAGPSAARRADELTKAKARIAELERVIGRQQADLHFFREALRLWDATSRTTARPSLRGHRKNDARTSRKAFPRTPTFSVCAL